jgi:hypothetical protein
LAPSWRGSSRTSRVGGASRWRRVAIIRNGVLAIDRVTRGLIGEVQVVTTPEEIRFETKKGALEGAFIRAAEGQQISMVAGA